MATAQQVLDQARAWIGLKESDNSYYEVLNTYNSHKPLARGYAIKPGDSWCDAFVSAVAIKAGAVDLIGTEVSCEQHIAIFKAKGIWVEDGTIAPEPGDVILYNWDSSSQPNDGGADHIGYVESVSNGYITVIEGNKSDAVGRRTLKVGSGSIRGFAKPKYAGGGEWVKDGERWWYRHSDGGFTANGWELIDGKWYLFDSEGWMRTGWVQVGGKWYYLAPIGTPDRPDGSMYASEWAKVDGKWYYLTDSGAMATGWVLDNGTWYYTDGSGAMQTGWLEKGGKWYFLNPDGSMSADTVQQIGGTWYVFDDSGEMQSKAFKLVDAD